MRQSDIKSASVATLRRRITSGNKAVKGGKLYKNGLSAITIEAITKELSMIKNELAYRKSQKTLK